MKKVLSSSKPPLDAKALPKRQGPVNLNALRKSQKTISAFIKVYCKCHHHTDGKTLCSECGELLHYAITRLSKCPYDPKPKCKECPTHCYKPAQRERIREVMRFSGMYFVKRGRLDWLFYYFWNGE